MPRQDRLPRLSVNTAAAAPPPSGITVSATGSLRGDGISVSMAGVLCSEGESTWRMNFDTLEGDTDDVDGGPGHAHAARERRHCPSQ